MCSLGVFCQSARKLFPLGIRIFPRPRSAARPIASNCDFAGKCSVMKTKLADRLAILQANDHFRDWQTLDDERVCVLCDRKFTGHEVLISTEGGELELHCPTPECKSGLHQWVHPGNSLLSEKGYDDWWHALGSSNGADGTDSSDDAVPSGQLRRL